MQRFTLLPLLFVYLVCMWKCEMTRYLPIVDYANPALLIVRLCLDLYYFHRPFVVLFVGSHHHISPLSRLLYV